MALVGAYLLGASGQVASGKLIRLALGSAFRTSTGVAAVSGCLAGPPNTMGELTLLSNTQLTVQPFRAVIQNTTDATAGQYVVPNDAVATLGAAQGFPAQDASQFRRAYVLTYVDDAQVTGSGANSAYLLILGGPLAASAAAATYPAVPNNALLLGELLIPPTGQTVTLTPYNPRTGIRHGILPVIADGQNLPGHSGQVGTSDGNYRDLPPGTSYGAGGPQRWNATAGAWQPAGSMDFPIAFIRQTVQSGVYTASAYGSVMLHVADVDTHGGFNVNRPGAGAPGSGDFRWTVPAGQGGIYRLDGIISVNQISAGSVFAGHFLKSGAIVRGGGLIIGVGRTDAVAMTFSAILNLAAADYIEIQGYSSQTWQTRISPGDGIESSMSIQRLR